MNCSKKLSFLPPLKPNCDALIRFFQIGFELKLCAIRKATQFQITLDSGEAEAIQLAKELHADRILMDERKARRTAAAEGLAVIGLLGVVILARERGMIPSARQLLDRLDADAGIYLAADLRERALKRVGE